MDQFFFSSRMAMLVEYVAVNQKQNPVAQLLPKATSETLTCVLGQYVLFPLRIVSFLMAARAKANEAHLDSVCEELTRNIGEELGTQTNGSPHVEILMTGLSEAFGIEDLQCLGPFPETAAFLDGVGEYLSASNRTTAEVIGAVYALESSAVPELVIVRQLVDRLAVMHGVAVGDDLDRFFDLHLQVWEPGHEEGLRNVVAPYLESQASKAEFENGFRQVMEFMDSWWQGLAYRFTATEPEQCT